MFQVTMQSVREVMHRNGDYYYKDTGERVPDSARLGHHAHVFRRSSEDEHAKPDRAGLDALGNRIEALRQEALRRAGLAE